MTGKYRRGQQFGDDDFRSRYFAGDRIDRTVERVERMRAEVAKLPPEGNYTLADVALRFVLAQPAVSTVIPGIRTVAQAEANTAATDLPPLSEALLLKLRDHAWLRAFWYAGK